MERYPVARIAGHDGRDSAHVPRVVVGFAAALLVGTGIAWMFLFSRARGEPIGLLTAFVRQLPLTGPTLLLAPAIVWLARRLPIRHHRWHARLAAHSAGLLGLLVVNAALSAVAMRLSVPSKVSDVGWGDLLFTVTSGWLYLWTLTYAAIVATVQAYDYLRELREQERLASRLETRLLEAQLASLRGQLQPHFLFNALQTASGLMSHDPAAARSVLRRLGDLLRRSLESTRHQIVPLANEIDFIRRYLEIQMARFPDRLTALVDVPEDLMELPVPSFVLQPLVENAMRHGVADWLRPGCVEVTARRDDATLCLVVRDDGAGSQTSPPEEWTEGVGLSSTRQRLAGLYGDLAGLDVVVRAEGGVEVRLRLPIEVSPHGAGSPIDKETVVLWPR